MFKIYGSSGIVFDNNVVRELVRVDGRYAKETSEKLIDQANKVLAIVPVSDFSRNKTFLFIEKANGIDNVYA